MKDQLNRLEKSLVDAGAVTFQTMTPQQLVDYLREQVAELNKQEDAAARALHQASIFAALQVAKNFEGPTTGAMTIPMFTGPGAKRVQRAAVPAAGARGTTNFGVGDGGPATRPTVSGGGGGSAGAALPQAGASGAPFVPPAVGKDDGPEDKPPEQPESDVTKTADADDFWPLDMNSDYGKGKTEDPFAEEPDFGFDPGSAGAVVLESTSGRSRKE